MDLFSIGMIIFWFAYTIAVIFLVVYFIPTIVSYLIDIHQNNLADIKEQELEEVK